MGKTTKRYFVKLPVTWLDNYIIKELQSMKNGSDMILVYLRMILLSAQEDGNLRLDEKKHYDAKKLSRVTGISEDIVQETINILKDEEEIEQDADGLIYLHTVPLMIVSETADAERMRLKREEDKQKKLSGEQCSNNVGQCSDDANNVANREEKEKDLEQEEENNRPSSSLTPVNLSLLSHDELICRNDYELLYYVYGDIKNLNSKSNLVTGNCQPGSIKSLNENAKIVYKLCDNNKDDFIFNVKKKINQHFWSEQIAKATNNLPVAVSRALSQLIDDLQEKKEKQETKKPAYNYNDNPPMPTYKVYGDDDE